MQLCIWKHSVCQMKIVVDWKYAVNAKHVSVCHMQCSMSHAAYRLGYPKKQQHHLHKRKHTSTESYIVASIACLLHSHSHSHCHSHSVMYHPCGNDITVWIRNAKEKVEKSRFSRSKGKRGWTKIPNIFNMWHNGTACIHSHS